MVVKNGKAPAKRKIASSGSKSTRSNSVSKGGTLSQHVAETDKLDGAVDCTEATALESEEGDRVLEAPGIDDGASGDDLFTESTQLTVITSHETQLKVGDRFTDGTQLATVSIISKADIYLDRDNGGSVCFPANELESFGWKLCDAWNPADFGELHYVAESDGQLNLLDWTDKEPPEPDDYESIELFDQAYKQWEDSQQSTVNSQQLAVVTPRERYELHTGNDASELTEELCNTLMDGLTYAQESLLASPTLESNSGEEAPTSFVNGTNIVNQFSEQDIQAVNIDSATSKQSSLQSHNSAVEYNLSLLARLAPHSHLMESDSDLRTVETASPTCSEQSETCNLDSQSSKMSPACLTAHIPLATNQEATSATSSTPYPRAGMTQNGTVFPQRTLEAPGVEKDSLLLRSPGALSTGNGRPPGQCRLESQLNQLVLIQDGEVANPEFLELGYQLPIGFTNLQENRTALELAQQQPIDHKSELQVETAIIAIDAQPLAMHSTGELEPLPLNEFNISLTLPANIGALTKNELLTNAIEQHQLINIIERKEIELGIEKLYRARLTGLYFQEFKKRCRHGEFEAELENCGLKSRTVQKYMLIAKSWEIIEAEVKAPYGALLAEENLGINWALDLVATQKKQLKSAAPPKDPDSWQTPNTKEQPIVALVEQALGGSIWTDPCSCASSKIRASLRYYKETDGLASYQAWTKTCFINPPFSDPLPWVEKTCLSIARGNISAAIMLLKAGTVSNVGTGELIAKYASAICYWRGRIDFLNDEGYAIKGSNFDCVFIYFGDRLDLFRKAFAGRGTISTIDNHYSSVNKKYLDQPETYTTVAAEERQMAGVVGLSNGRSLLPDTRDRDRDAMERHDPSTVFENMPTVFASTVQPEISAEIQSISDEFQQAKSDCLDDYITAISGNLPDFSDEQLKFLVTIAKKELNDRNHPEYFRQRPRKRQN